MDYSSSSGSMHSSGGGGDEEFDESFSAFLKSSRTSAAASHACADISSIEQPQLPPTRLEIHHQNHPPSFLFDPLSSCLDIFPQSTPPPAENSLQNFSMVSSRGFTSAMGGQSVQSCRRMPGTSSSTPPPRASSPSGPSNVAAAAAAVRNPRKRARASRRAPTTVLTTDTSNFRSMVQEFTGIPSPPFSVSPFLGSRLNLFSASSTARFNLEQQPLPYPFRPFDHKLLLPPSIITSSSSMVASTVTNNVAGTTATATATGSANPTFNRYQQLPCELGLPRQSQNSVNMQNPAMRSFQSLPQTSSNYPPFPDHVSINIGAKWSQTCSTSDSILLEEFNRTHHGQLNTGNITQHTESSSKSFSDEWDATGEPH